MCFRPSAVAGSEPQVQMGTCPSCGQPVAASVGITSGKCPYCKEPITAESTIGGMVVDAVKNVKII